VIGRLIVLFGVGFGVAAATVAVARVHPPGISVPTVRPYAASSARDSYPRPRYIWGWYSQRPEVRPAAKPPKEYLMKPSPAFGD
jgi:hypothetical protein